MPALLLQLGEGGAEQLHHQTGAAPNAIAPLDPKKTGNVPRVAEVAENAGLDLHHVSGRLGGTCALLHGPITPHEDAPEATTPELRHRSFTQAARRG